MEDAWEIVEVLTCPYIAQYVAFEIQPRMSLALEQLNVCWRAITKP